MELTPQPKMSPEKVIENMGLNPDMTYVSTFMMKGAGYGIGHTGGITAPENGFALHPRGGKSDSLVFLTKKEHSEYEWAKMQYDIGLNRDKLESAAQGNPFEGTKRYEAAQEFMTNTREEASERERAKLPSLER